MVKLSIPSVASHIITKHKDTLSKPCTEEDIAVIATMYTLAKDTITQRHGYKPTDSRVIMYVEYLCLHNAVDLVEFINWNLYGIEP